MADWYVSSANYNALPVWQPNTPYTVGQLIRQATTSGSRLYVHRCVTAGTSAATEPGWSSWSVNLNGNTTGSGTAVFNNVSGQSAYGWAAASGTFHGYSYEITNGMPVGDRVFIASDHVETVAPAYFNLYGLGAFGGFQIISVNRAGSVPPVAADVQPGAKINTTSGVTFENTSSHFYQGITWTHSGGSIMFNSSSVKNSVFKDCAWVITTTNSAFIFTTNNGAAVTWDNTTVSFGNAGQGIGRGSYSFDFNWLNTPSAIRGAVIPTILFQTTGYNELTGVCRGVDFSALTTTLVGSGGQGASKILFDNCKFASGVIRLATNFSNAIDEAELNNCYIGTNIASERYSPGGSMVTDRSTTMSSGATDGVGAFSFKLASNANSDIVLVPVNSFFLDVDNTITGSARTATVEIISANALNTNDICLSVRYLGTAGSTLTNSVNSMPTVLSAAALPASAATWAGSFYTWNAADLSNIALTNNNLTATATFVSGGQIRSPAVLAAGGKYYWECTVNMASANSSIGICLSSAPFSPGFAFGAGTAGIVASNGQFYVNSVFQSGVAFGAPAANQLIGIAVDRAANLMWMRYGPSGNWNSSGTANPATGVGGRDISSIATGPLMPAFFAFANAENCTANFGASAFSGAVPAGFTAGLSMTKQRLQVNFTPQTAGRVRGRVHLGKPNTNVWINPQLILG